MNLLVALWPYLWHAAMPIGLLFTLGLMVVGAVFDQYHKRTGQGRYRYRRRRW
jgi:hypothetical protein